MSRRLLVPLVALAVAVPAGALVLALVFRGDGRDGGAETAREALVRPTVRATLSPEVHRFGEPVTATIDLTVRRSELDERTPRPGADFEPYAPLGRARRELDDFGALAHVRFTVPLQCLRQACLPQTQTGDFQFGPASVTWRRPAPPGRKFADRRLDQRAASASWPPVEVASWLSPGDVEAARWRSALGELPEPGYAVSPRWLAAGLAGGAVALVLLAALLVGGAVREAAGRRTVVRAEEAQARPLDRALALVEESRGGGDVPGRRVALETLARELRLGGERGLAGDAERLAWSAEAPGDGAVATLLAAVRRNGSAA